MFANHPLSMVRYRQRQTESLLRNAADRTALDAQRGRGRQVQAQPPSTIEAPNPDEGASSAPRRQPAGSVWEPASGD